MNPINPHLKLGKEYMQDFSSKTIFNTEVWVSTYLQNKLHHRWEKKYLKFIKYWNTEFHLQKIKGEQCFCRMKKKLENVRKQYYREFISWASCAWIPWKKERKKSKEWLQHLDVWLQMQTKPFACCNLSPFRSSSQVRHTPVSCSSMGMLSLWKLLVGKKKYSHSAQTKRNCPLITFENTTTFFLWSWACLFGSNCVLSFPLVPTSQRYTTTLYNVNQQSEASNSLNIDVRKKIQDAYQQRLWGLTDCSRKAWTCPGEVDLS